MDKEFRGYQLSLLSLVIRSVLELVLKMQLDLKSLFSNVIH